ncbi:MAG: DegT/DnrJ/EryC1/StrS family aminotransferase [Myxococcaceae bacterium]
MASSPTSNPQQIPLFKVWLPPEQALMPRLRDVLYSGQISEGEPVQRFEAAFGKLVQSPNVLSFYSGTAALHSALVLVGVQPGDDVVSTAMTAEPSNIAIHHAQANVVWADVDPLNGVVTGESVAAAITPRTKAIMVVHYGGIPAPIDAIRAVAEARGIPVIEDAAHALGARYGGKPLGSHSEVVMFSLQAIKHMTTVDGGMLTVRDPALLPKGRLFRWFGIDRLASRTDVDVATVGWKYHMNNVTATIGLVQLDHIGGVLERYIDNGKWFDRTLAGTPGLTMCKWDPKAEPSYWFYSVLAERRDDLAKKLTERGIGNGLVHKRNDRHSLFASSKKPLPGLDQWWEKMLHIPCGWWVGAEERERIASVIREGW